MLTRAEFLRTAGLAGVAAAFTLQAAPAPSADVRPNILWLSTEDISPNLGCYGDPYAHTPTLDAFAAAGVRYTNAYTVAPVCAPNRATVISGVYASTLGAHPMRSGGEGAVKTLPRLPGGMKLLPGYLREAGYYCTNNVKEDFNFEKPKDTWDESSAQAHWRNRADKSQPFFAVFNFVGTHESAVRASAAAHAANTARLTSAQRQNPDAIVPPPYHPNTPVVREQWAHYHECITALDYWIADHLRELDEDGLADNTIVMFWSDHGAGIPRCKRWLYDSGTHIPLIVRAPKRWQELCAITPGSVDDRLISSIDLAPTVLALASAPIPQHMLGQPFLGAKRPAPREFVYGARDRMDERYDMFRSARDKRFLYIRNYMPFAPYGQYLDYNEQSPIMRELRRLAADGSLPEDAQWVTRKTKSVEELYDCEHDPHNLHNLASAPEHKSALERLRAAHQRWTIETRDLGLIPEAEFSALEKEFGFRYEIIAGLQKRDPEIVRRLRAIADKAAAPQPTDLPGFRDALNSPSASIRYWATLGAAHITPQGPSEHECLLAAANDGSGVVRITAAKALCATESGRSEWLPLLIRELSSGDQWIRLQAALALDDLGSGAKPAVPALETALKDRENKYVVRVAAHALMTLTGRTMDPPA